MSRQNKMARKRLMCIVATHEVDDKGSPTMKRRKGPARTIPKHGKVNRWPYDAEWRRDHIQRHGGSSG